MFHSLRLGKKESSSDEDLDQAVYNIEQEKNHHRSLKVPDESCHHGGYLNLVNLHRVELQNCEEEFLPISEEFPTLRTTHTGTIHESASRDENSSVRSKVSNNAQHNHYHPAATSNHHANNNSSSNGNATGAASSNNNSKPKIKSNSPQLKQEVSVNETLRSIVDNDKSWSQIQQEMKNAQMYTSFGIREVCKKYVKAKAEELRAEKIEQARREEEREASRGSFDRLRKRLSMML